MWKKLFQYHNFPKIDAIEDTKDNRDYRAEEVYPELASASPVNWVEKTEWRKFPILNQKSTSSCVAHAVAKLIGIEFYNYTKAEYGIGEYVDLSRRDIYTRRANKPYAGMSFRDAMEIGAGGVTLETLMPSKPTEFEMNLENDRMKWKDFVAQAFQGENYLAIPFNIDDVARVLDRGHGVLLGLKFNAKKYCKPVPELPDGDIDSHHGVAVVDNTIYNGKRALVADDSHGINASFNGQRIITEDWFDAGLVTACWNYESLEKLWLDSNDDESEPTKPIHQFDVDLNLGTHNDDIKKLQECLDFLGMYDLPGNYTGYFGGLTLKAVKKFQEQYASEILTPLGLTQATGYVGLSTRKKLNELFK